MCYLFLVETVSVFMFQIKFYFKIFNTYVFTQILYINSCIGALFILFGSQQQRMPNSTPYFTKKLSFHFLIHFIKWQEAWYEDEK